MYIFTAVNSGERCGPWASCVIILQEGSLGDPQPKLLKPFRSVEHDGRQNYNRKTFKRLLLIQKMDFEIIIQECFFSDPPPKLLKRFRYVEQNGYQGYK